MNQTQQTSAKPVGPYCPWPQDAWDGTCVHPPGCSEVVAELHREHLANLDRRVAKLLGRGS